MAPIRIFICYSHRDTEYLSPDSLLGFLRSLQTEEDVEIWSDQRIETGTLWDDAIRSRLQDSDIALILVSQSFLDSAYCTNIEMKTFLGRRRDDGMILFPILLSPCEWERRDWLAATQCLPGGDETIEEHYAEPAKRKRLFLRIRQELRAAIGRVRNKPAPAAAPATAERLPGSIAERRLVTAIRCDVVPLESDGRPVSGDDLPEILHDLMPPFEKLCSEVFDEFKGRRGETAGSGVTGLFGYPNALEDDARSAVRAGLAIVERAAKMTDLGIRFAVRAGIHCGRVIADANGTTPLGELANTETAETAIRLQELAPLNGVVVSDAVTPHIEGFFEIEAGGFLQSPSRQEMRVSRILRDTGFQTRIQTATGLITRFIGREGELQQMVARWNDVRASKGQVVVVRADAGIGKSRLVTETRKQIAGESSWWFTCRCSPRYQNTAFFPLIAWLENWTGIEATDSDDVKLAKVEATLTPFADAIDDLVPPVAALLSITRRPMSRRSSRIVKSREANETTQQVLAQLIVELTSRKPAVFVVEDLQWIDPSTMELLDILVEQAPSIPLLVLVTVRPEQVPAEWMRREYVNQVTLDRLDRQETLEMVLAVTGGKPLPAPVLEEIVARTDGVPLFIEDLTRMVLESDIVVERDDYYDLTRPFQSLAVPSTIHETILARFAKLTTAKPIAQVAATIGREFSVDMLRIVSGVDAPVLLGELNRLIASGLLYRRGFGSKAKYVFKHALVQEALQESLLKRQRRRYHEKIAELLERDSEAMQTQPELIAYHYGEAGMSMKAARAWGRAAWRALECCANREALQHVQRGLDALSTLPADTARDDAELLLRLFQGAPLVALHGSAHADVGRAYTRALDLARQAPPTPQLFAALRGAAMNRAMSGRLFDAITNAGELHEMAHVKTEPHLVLESHAVRCATFFWTGSCWRAAQEAHQALALYEPERHHVSHWLRYGEDPAAAAYTYGILSEAAAGRRREAASLSERALAAVEQWSQPHSRAFLLSGVAWGAIELNDVDGARRHGQAIIDIAAENRFAAWSALGSVFKGWALAARGNLADGIALMADGRHRWHETGARVAACWIPARIAQLYAAAGRTNDALQWIDVGLSGASTFGDGYYLPELHRLRGDLLAASSGADCDVIDAYRQAVGIARDQHAGVMQIRAGERLARLYVARNRRAEALAVLNSVCALRDVDGDMGELSAARALLSSVAPTAARP
ncbi:MAG TPA: AAA family ATPase [Thermoanaerobaculia bacterium]|jgi:class 3 adenylate cyclase|nr:AAA family ATPase [Thermoanaerobaculia bacterium]